MSHNEYPKQNLSVVQFDFLTTEKTATGQTPYAGLCPESALVGIDSLELTGLSAIPPGEVLNYIANLLSLPAKNSMITAVDHMNKIAGKEPVGGWTAIIQQNKLIQSEAKELRDAIEEKDIDKARDAIADILVTTIGMGSVAPIPVLADFELAMAGVMTRFDDTAEKMADSVDKHMANGLMIDTLESVVNGKTYWVCKSAIDQVGLDGDHYPANKFLKSAHFSSPEFPPLEGELAPKPASPVTLV